MTMGTLEQTSAKRAKRKKLREIILTTIGTAGIIGIGLVAPNAAGVMIKMGLVPGKKQKQAIDRARDRLIEQGLLRREGGFLRITPRGQILLKKIEAAGYRRVKRERWDGRWRMLIFDIPEYRKPLREKVRRTLMAMGFVLLQRSVWIYPYDCEELMALLKADFKIGKDMRYVIADTIESDGAYKKMFGLQ